MLLEKLFCLSEDCRDECMFACCERVGHLTMSDGREQWIMDLSETEGLFRSDVGKDRRLRVRAGF